MSHALDRQCPILSSINHWTNHKNVQAYHENVHAYHENIHGYHEKYSRLLNLVRVVVCVYVCLCVCACVGVCVCACGLAYARMHARACIDTDIGLFSHQCRPLLALA